MRVYIILENDLREMTKNIYGVYKNKEDAKKKVDALNKQNAYDLSDSDFDYTLETHELIETMEE